MADIIQIRRGTSSNWQSANPILAHGEMGLELDDSTLAPIDLKIGDGTTQWNDLTSFFQSSTASNAGTGAEIFIELLNGVIKLRTLIDSPDISFSQIGEEIKAEFAALVLKLDNSPGPLEGQAHFLTQAEFDAIGTKVSGRIYLIEEEV